MVNYFASYIPYYAFIAKPLHSLLVKGSKWEWRAEHEIAFLQAKDALSAAPILGHPIQGSPYRLYTDASDYALGSSLQQVQPMVVADLKGTAAYDKLQAAWDAGKPVPKLFTTLDKDVKEMEEEDVWGETLDETRVHVERVIAYWSRSLKSAERNYSATECEALGAKEALVRFQPFIEGEQVILVTNHAALQWARVYENANRRLAAWGAVFAAYPGLRIVHRAGRVHSNVDPLSRLPRTPPHESPVLEDMNTIVQDAERRKEAQRLEDKGECAPAKKAAFAIWWWEDAIDKYALPVTTRQQKAKERGREQGSAEQTTEEEMIRARMEARQRHRWRRCCREPSLRARRPLDLSSRCPARTRRGGLEQEIAPTYIRVAGGSR
jgi:hypothetical protein